MGNVLALATDSFFVHGTPGALPFHSVLMFPPLDLCFVLLLVVPHDSLLNLESSKTAIGSMSCQSPRSVLPPIVISGMVSTVIQ
jgi:hypothetical protein